MNVDVLVIGAGPSGLGAAVELRRLGVGAVLVVDRETAAGGIPRHSWHTGYGLRDLHRIMTGPAYARTLADAAQAAGAEIRLGTTVTGWAPGVADVVRGEGVPAGGGVLGGGGVSRGGGAREGGAVVMVTSAQGVETVRAGAVLLATGCRERPRAARLVPGDRPPGVMTTGELQQRVYLNGERRPGRAVVVGAEHVSFSAVLTLAHAGAQVVALVTEHERQQSYAAFRLGAALRWRVPVWTSTAVRLVVGRERLAGVEVADLQTGAVRFVPCDTLVFSGDWIPDHELARSGGLDMDPGTRGPVVDTRLSTTAAGVFAAGNLVHAAETADIAALSGRHAARHIAAFLGGGAPGTLGGGAPGTLGDGAPRAWGVAVTAEAPLRWISPNAVSLGVPPPLGRFVLRSGEFRRLARLEVRQDARVLRRSRPVQLIPGRPVYLGAGWLTRVDPTGGVVRVGVANDR